MLGILLSQYNFDARGVTVILAHDVLPYAFGTHEVFVPWQVVNPLLTRRFEELEVRLLALS